MANKVSFLIQFKDQFSPAAKKIKASMQGVTNAAKKTANSVSNVKDKIKSLNITAKSLAKTGGAMSLAITTPFLLMSKSMVEAASDATETANKFNAVFDDVEGKANQVADEFSKSFGVAGSTARKMIGDTGDLLVGFGFAGDEALELSRKVNELASDLNSFQNFEGGASGASEALTKALLGETESAKSLGIVIRQDTDEFRNQVSAIAAARGISEQQAKSIVILAQATEQSKKAVGDVSRTWNDHASVVRRNEEAVKKLKESFGVLLIPFVTKLTLKLTKLVQWFTTLSPFWKKTVIGITAVLAIGGPLLVMLASIAIAVNAITWPILLIVAAVAAVIAAIVMMAYYWDDIVAGMKDVWQAFAGLVTDVWEGVVSIVIGAFDLLIGEIKRKISIVTGIAKKVAGFFGFGGGSEQVNVNSTTAPTAPVSSTNGTVAGNIVVSAEKGTKVKNTKMQNIGQGLNIGLNVAEGAR
jgi:hypothetical protein